MKGKISRVTLLILLVAFVLTTLLVPMSAFAAKITTPATGYTKASDVKYVTSGNYIANWGARGEVATFLSTYAQNFYTGNYTFDKLSKVSGGSSQSNAPTSALYSQLKTLMTSKHSNQTGYQATRDMYKYTDCVSSNYNKISSFYSGKELNGAWDSGSTWNREHTWPNSKGLGGNDENDIMMLRPTWVSENSSRGNTAYGQSSGYFDPGESTRGDCARIVLYVYTRWGNTNYMWGSSGVMENMNVLLKWMEEDPVDTWEMGRNDAVQKITGTRNVFVDYPEYAFLLFGKDVPEDYPTPSGSNGVIAPNPGQGGQVPAHTCTSVCATCGNCMNATCAEIVCATKCQCLETPVPDSLEVGTAYYMSVVQGNLSNATLYFNGTTRESDGYPWYFKTSTDKASAVQVFVEESQGGYKLYFMNGTTKTYIRLYERESGKASLSLETTAPAEVYTYDQIHKTLILTVGSNKYYIGTYDTYDTLSGSNISYISTSFPCKFTPVEGGTVTPPAHTCQSKCSTCGGCMDTSCTESACSNKCPGHQTTPPVGGDTMEITFQSSTNSTTLNGSGDVSFTASRVVDNWDAGTRGLQFLKEKGNVTISSTASVNNVTSIALDLSENKDISITVTVKVGNTVLTCNGQNSATVGKGTNQIVTFTSSSAVSGVITVELVPSQSGVSNLGSMYVAGLTITTSSNSQGGGNQGGNEGGGTVTPPVVTPDATVEAFKLAVTNIPNSTTMQQKFEAIKTAVDIYNTMNDTQKSQATTEIETLKSYITDYNANVTLQNTNSNNALKVAVQVAGMATLVAVAFVLSKKVF